MKKFTYVFGLVLCASLLFSSCDFGPKYDVEIESIVTEIKSDMGSVGISEKLQSKKAFLVQMNPSEYSLTGSTDSITDKTFASSIKMKNVPFRPKTLSVSFDSLYSGARTASESTTETVYAVGDTKSFYSVNEDNSLNTTYAANCVCKAVGDHCYVWYKAKSGITITDSALEKLAKKFDDIFENETYIFGSNIPKISYSNIIPVTEDTKIHIVVYDLFDDYLTTKKNQGGTFGYYYSTDMLTNDYILNVQKTTEYKSNELELINIDSFFLSESDYEESAISTLAHEFQHMLNFVQKSLNNNRSSSIWFDEMMSMVCEDIMQEHLGISDEAAPRSRIPTFNYGYNLGFTTWYDDDNVYASYANAYVFGAFLLRNFGIDFIRELAQNTYVDQKAITQALINTNQTVTSFDEVFENYWNVILYPDATSGWTLNKAVSKTYTINGSSVAFNCTAINPADYYIDFEEGRFYGPLVIKDEYASTVGIGPYGMLVSYIGTDLESFDVSEFTTDEALKKFYLVFTD